MDATASLTHFTHLLLLLLASARVNAPTNQIAAGRRKTGGRTDALDRRLYITYYRLIKSPATRLAISPAYSRPMGALFASLRARLICIFLGRTRVQRRSVSKPAAATHFRLRPRICACFRGRAPNLCSNDPITVCRVDLIT